MISQGYKKDNKEVGSQLSNALKKALSMVKIYMAGLIIQFVRRESQNLVDLELPRESGGVSKNRLLGLRYVSEQLLSDSFDPRSRQTSRWDSWFTFSWKEALSCAICQNVTGRCDQSRFAPRIWDSHRQIQGSFYHHSIWVFGEIWDTLFRFGKAIPYSARNYGIQKVLFLYPDPGVKFFFLWPL